jgi:hypothetical protein
MTHITDHSQIKNPAMDSNIKSHEPELSSDIPCAGKALDTYPRIDLI